VKSNIAVHTVLSGLVKAARAATGGSAGKRSWPAACLYVALLGLTSTCGDDAPDGDAPADATRDSGSEPPFPDAGTDSDADIDSDASFNVDRYRCPSVVEIDRGADGANDESIVTLFRINPESSEERWDQDGDGLADARWIVASRTENGIKVASEEWDDRADGVIDARREVSFRCVTAWGGTGCIMIGSTTDSDGDESIDERWSTVVPDLPRFVEESLDRDGDGVTDERWTAGYVDDASAGYPLESVEWDRDANGVAEARVRVFYSSPLYPSHIELDSGADGTVDARITWTKGNGVEDGGVIPSGRGDLDADGDGVVDASWSYEGLSSVLDADGNGVADERWIMAADGTVELDRNADGITDQRRRPHRGLIPIERAAHAHAYGVWEEDSDGDGDVDRSCTTEPGPDFRSLTASCTSRTDGAADFRLRQALGDECLIVVSDRFVTPRTANLDAHFAVRSYSRTDERSGLAASRAYVPLLPLFFRMFELEFFRRDFNLGQQLPLMTWAMAGRGR
jgi:hypothetical protein